MNVFDKYLSIFKLKKEKPTLGFLEVLIHKQLEFFPYENISKIIFFEEHGARLQTFEEYLDAQIEFGYGGTCYPQNIYFSKLLKSLGYDVNINQASVNDKSGLHVTIEVTIENEKYLVDFGFMDAFCGPFNKDQSYQETFIDRVFKYYPSSGDEGFKFEIWDKEELVLKFIEEKVILDLSELDQVIEQSYSFDTYFMSNLVLGRRWGNPCYNLRNQETYFGKDGKVHIKSFKTNQDVEEFVKTELALAKYPILKCFEILEGRK